MNPEKLKLKKMKIKEVHATLLSHPKWPGKSESQTHHWIGHSKEVWHDRQAIMKDKWGNIHVHMEITEIDYYRGEDLPRESVYTEWMWFTPTAEGWELK